MPEIDDADGNIDMFLPFDGSASTCHKREHVNQMSQFRTPPVNTARTVLQPKAMEVYRRYVEVYRGLFGGLILRNWFTGLGHRSKRFQKSGV